MYSFTVWCSPSAKVDGLALAYVDDWVHKFSNRTSLLRAS